MENETSSSLCTSIFATTITALALQLAILSKSDI